MDLEKIWSKSKHKRKGRPFTAIKVWLVVGTVLTCIFGGPFSILFSFGSAGIAIGYILGIIVSVTTCVLTYHRINTANSQKDIVPFAVCALLFCSLIGGILLLVVKDSQWIDTSEKPHLPLEGGEKESDGNEEWRFR